MGRQQDGVAVLLHFRDVAVELAACLRVEPGRRLVQEDDLRFVDERERQGQPLALTAGKSVEGGVALSTIANRSSSRCGSALRP